MGIVIRQSFYSSIIAYCGVVIGYVNLLYLYPKFLDPEQIGLLRTIQDAAILFTPFAQFGLAQSIARYFPRLVKSKEATGSFLSLVLLIALGGFILFLCVFKFFEGTILSYFETNANEILSFSSLVIWLTLILLVLGIFESYSRTLLKTIVPNLLREIVSRILLGVLVSVYFLGWINFNTFIISTAGAYLVCLMMLIFYLMTIGEFKISFSLREINKAEIPGLIKYSALSFAGTAGLIIVGKVDSIMISALIGLSANAVYTTAFYMATVIEIPKRAINQLTMPMISRSFEKDAIHEIKTLYQKASINQFIIGGLLLIGIWANLDNIFFLIPRRETYEIGKWVVIIIGLGKLLDMAFGPNSEIIVMSKHYSFNLVLIVILAITIIAANNWLIPIYGIEGAAYGSAGALILYNLIKLVFVFVKLKIQPFSLATLKVLGISALVVGLNFILPSIENVFLDILYRSVIIALTYGALIIQSKASPDGNALLKKGLSIIKSTRKS